MLFRAIGGGIGVNQKHQKNKTDGVENITKLKIDRVKDNIVGFDIFMGRGGVFFARHSDVSYPLKLILF